MVISNQNSYRVLFDKIVSVYFIWNISLYFSTGNGQPREPALCGPCQWYRHAFVLYGLVLCILSLMFKLTRTHRTAAGTWPTGRWRDSIRSRCWPPRWRCSCGTVRRSEWTETRSTETESMSLRRLCEHTSIITTGQRKGRSAVSYTHLTLPTTPYV